MDIAPKQNDTMLSVIIPVYNEERYLERCIKSLISQTYKNVEIIFVDDGSTDNSLSICKRYEKKDKRIITINQKNSGQNAARRKGLDYASGKYVSFIDSDDWIESTMFQHLISLYEKHSCDLVTSGIFMDSDKGKRSYARYDSLEEGLYLEVEKEVFPVMLYDFRKHKAGIDGHLVNKIFEINKIKQVFEQIDREIIMAEDSLALYMYCLLCKSIYISKECFYHYDMKDGTASNTPNERLLFNTYLVYQNFIQVFQNYKTPYVLLRQLKYLILYLEMLNLKLLYNIDLNTQGEWKFGYTKDFFDYKIVIYGAGTCGKALYYQFVRLQKEDSIVAWVDKSANEKSDECLYDINYPNVLKDVIFDYIVIAVMDKKLMLNIKDSLVENYGISEEKIIWKPTEAKNILENIYF